MKIRFIHILALSALTCSAAWAEDKVKPVDTRCAAACAQHFKACYNGQEENDKNCSEQKRACLAVCPLPKDLKDSEKDSSK